MKKVVSRTEYLGEEVNFEAIHEDEVLDLDIALDEKPEDVVKALKGVEDVTAVKPTDFGIIKAKAPKKKIAAIKALKGVEYVNVAKKK